MGKADSELCEHCNVLESLQHFFYYCPIAKKLWKEIQRDLHGIQLTERSVMLVVDVEHDNSQNINLYILIGKLVISKYRYGNYPNILQLYEAEKRVRKLW